MRIGFITLAWYDFFMGMYYSRARQCLYVHPLPCVGFYVQFQAKTSPEPECPGCGAQMEEVEGRYGPFLSCWRRKCDWTHALNADGSLRGVPSSQITRIARRVLHRKITTHVVVEKIEREVLVDHLWDELGWTKSPDGARLTCLNATQCDLVLDLLEQRMINA